MGTTLTCDLGDLHQQRLTNGHLMHAIDANEAMGVGMYGSAQTTRGRNADISFIHARSIGDAK